VESSLWKEMVALFCKPLIDISPLCLPRPFFFFFSDIWQLVNSNSGLDVCYGDNPTVGRIGYIHEVLARLLYIYEGLVDFEVIWFGKKDNYQFRIEVSNPVSLCNKYWGCDINFI
jgi:hypothetical protein